MTGALVAIAAGVAVGAGSSSAATTTCVTSGPLICLDIEDTPDPVSRSTATAGAYLGHTITARNASSSTVNHATLSNLVGSGATLVSASTTHGTCTVATATCDLGQLPSGARAVVTLVTKAPETAGTLVTSPKLTFAEQSSDNPDNGGKQDTVQVTETTTVQTVEGAASSLVPADTEVQVNTDSTGTGLTTAGNPTMAKATVPARPVPGTASLRETKNGPAGCPAKVICRGGDWIEATIPGEHFPPLRFELRWDDSVVPASQSVKNLAVLHADCVGDVCEPPEVIKARCSGANPAKDELPCLFNVREDRSGRFQATLLSLENGRMR